jgi:hypothetical protein
LNKRRRGEGSTGLPGDEAKLIADSFFKARATIKVSHAQRSKNDRAQQRTSLKSIF